MVEFDRPRLGDLTGLRVVHLQCHIGTDTVSLARLGAAQVTGLDFSPGSLAQARALADRTGTALRLVEAPVYDALTVLEPASFDLVYTGIGALCWLPDIRRWAAVVAGLLRPGGRLFLREGHPMIWTLDDGATNPTHDIGRVVVEYPYFETSEPMVFDQPGTYVATDVEFVHTRTHEWNHGLGEIVSALLEAGMEITGLEEHDSVPWEALPGQMVCTDGEWRLADRPERLAASYTLRALRRPDVP